MNHELQKTERTRERRVVAPATDIYETQDKIVLLCDVPGAVSDSVEVTLEQDLLTLEARVARVDHKGFRLSHSERPPHDYWRQFTVAADVDRDKISATVKDGVLEVILPKAERAKPRRIAIKAD
jgi:HSP20 family molecular chaperone IbpA